MAYGSALCGVIGVGRAGRLAWMALGLASIAILAAGPISGAMASSRMVSRAGGTAVVSQLGLVVNKSQTIRVSVPVSDVLIGSSDIADVVPISDRSIYLLGKKVGTTNVSLFDADKKLVSLIEIEVKPDLDNLDQQIRQSTGDGSLRIKNMGERTVLTGVAHDGPTVDRAMQVAPPGTVNLTRVKSPQQVLLKVRFIEVNRTAGRDLGLRLEYGSQRTAINSGLVGNPTQVTSRASGISVTGLAGAAVNSALGAGVPFGTLVQSFGGSSNQLDLFINALESKGLLRRLAEPNLIAMSGDRAEFLAGGEIPIPIANQSISGAPQITVSYKEFGVKLAFTPTVLTNGAIHLLLEPEVSDIDPTLAVAVGGGVSVPGLTKRRAKTAVELRDGQSFAIAGLLQNQSNRSIDQLPFLGSIPILGALFRSTAFQERETELVVIVTPGLVKPAKPGQLLATPLETTLPANDVDLFLNGQLEVRRDVREFVAANGGQVGPHGHMMPRGRPPVPRVLN